MSRLRAVSSVAVLASALVVPALTGFGASPASSTPASAATTYMAGAPSVATITNGTSAAPWNEYQGDGAPGLGLYDSQSPGTVLPTYTPGGVETGSGATAEPNLAVFPSASSGATAGAAPYAAGVVGTPGTLDGYCGTGNDTTEAAGAPVRQPAGTTLPLAPAYFPHIIRNADGTLTGYFDYRPKDADEAIVAATSTDNGKDWTYDGEALEENPGYCPVADLTDDGEGHPNVLTIGDNTYMYTLPRAAGDMQGVGMIVHRFSPTETNPLGDLPANEEVGIDPDAFVPSGDGPYSINSSTPTSVALTSLGTANSPEQLVAGSFVDLSQTPNTPGTPQYFTCTGLSTSPTSLTGCTTQGSTTINVHPGDLIEQVLGFTTPSSDVGLVVPAGPNNTLGTGGLASLTIDSTSGNPGFANPLTGATFNNNAPNRLYIDGTAIYCTQANANPTTHIEDCTTGSSANPQPYTISNPLEPITGDPIIPATSYDPAAGDGMTTGLVAPDGIVGTLPSYPNDGSVPAGATYVMYTEKELSYYVAGETTGTGTLSTTTATSIVSTPGPYISSDLPSTGPVSIQIGATEPSKQGSATAIVPVTCTSVNEATGTFSGCTLPASASAYNSWTWASNSDIAAPGATTVSPTVLGVIGEGSTNVAKLYKNNEDLTVLRVAWTTDGTTFSTSGLTNGGVISGENNCAGTSPDPICSSASSYDDISNPATTVSPSNLNAYANNDAGNDTEALVDGQDNEGTDTGGTPDADEMRFVGSAGSVIVNPNGTYGLFLSGAWAADGDSDSFNQIFYSSSTNGEYWSVPTPVISTDYSFAASATQDAQLGDNEDEPLGISAYYSGRAYAPSVVQNPDGTLTMVFAGDRVPKSVTAAGTVLGTNSSQLYTVGTQDPALYRNILVVTLSSTTTPGVATDTVLGSTAAPGTTAGTSVTYTATVAATPPGTGTPTGSVSFATANGVISGCGAEPLDQSTPDQATCTINYAGPIDDSVQATYAGDSNYAGSASTTITTTSLTSSDAGSGVVGENVTYSATVADAGTGAPNPTGAVSFSDSAGAISACSSQGLALVGGQEVATCTVAYAAPTSDVVTAVYNGDASTVLSDTTLTETIDQAATTTDLGASDNGAGIVVGQPVTFTAQVAVNAPGAGIPTGTITLSDASGPISGCTDLTLSEGTPDSATCSTTYAAPMTDDLVADYSGDSDFLASASSTLAEQVNPASTTTAIAASAPAVVVGQPLVLTATVAVVAPGSGTPTGSVSFNDGDGVLGSSCSDQSLSLVAGQLQATCTVSFPAALASPDELTASYSGDGNFSGSTSSSLGEAVSQATTSVSLSGSDDGAGVVVGEPVTYTAEVGVSPPGAGTPTGTVDFTGLGGSFAGCSAVPLNGGAPDLATCTTTYTGVQSDIVTAAYSSDANFAASTSPNYGESVTADTTTVELSANPDPAVTGTPETLTAAVLVDTPGKGTPTGSVSFTAGSSTLCRFAPLNGSGVASCVVTYAKVSASPYSIVATYSGSGNDLAATSAPLSLSVTAQTHLAVTANPSPATFGRPEVLRGSGLPGAATGTVSFSVGSSLLCAATVHGGSASCSPSEPPVPGTYDVTGTYSGNSTYAPSSATTAFTVVKASSSISLRAVPKVSTYGSAVTLVASKIPTLGTGTVTFTVGTTELCQVPVSSTEVSCATSPTEAPATYQATATYSGDGNYIGSSATASFTVDKDRTSFNASATPSFATASQDVTLNALDLPGSASGTVSFTSGTTTLCVATVAGGGGTCTVVAGLADRTYHVKATYSGDADEDASTATTVFIVAPGGDSV